MKLRITKILQIFTLHGTTTSSSLNSKVCKLKNVKNWKKQSRE
jgi:hypothetical protein